MSEPPSKRLFERAGIEGHANAPNKSTSLSDYNREVLERQQAEERGTTGSSNATTRVDPNQEPMIPGFDEPGPTHEPEMRARMIRDVATELPNAEDFLYEAVYVYWNEKTKERFVQTPGTQGGTLYSPVGDVVR